ncbi:hypothetical protein Gorai_011765, partial [Gossypium raimondii]|nr:hypothetical protein [Gossypium raimondii]
MLLYLWILKYSVYSNRIPEAALMARSYLPSKVSEIVAIWRRDLNKVNPKAAESLADPREYPNLFEDWELALSVESKVAETRGVYPLAADYLNHADRSKMTLLEAFRNMQIDDEEPLVNGVLDYEAGEPNGHGLNSEEQNGEDGSQEEPVVVDADSNDGAVLVNGNEPEEEWGTNTEGTPAYTRSLGFMKTFSLSSIQHVLNDVPVEMGKENESRILSCELIYGDRKGEKEDEELSAFALKLKDASMAVLTFVGGNIIVGYAYSS